MFYFMYADTPTPTGKYTTLHTLLNQCRVDSSSGNYKHYDCSISSRRCHKCRCPEDNEIKTRHKTTGPQTLASLPPHPMWEAMGAESSQCQKKWGACCCETQVARQREEPLLALPC